MPVSPIPHGTPSGYSWHKCRCDVCVAAKKARDRAYYVANRQKPRRPPKYASATERTAAWRKANPEKAKANADRHRAKRREHRNAVALARYYRRMAEDPEAVRAAARAASKAPRAVFANRAARHRRRGAKPTPEGAAYMAVLGADPCSYCGGAGGEIDHITAITAGGDGDWLNLTAACRRCNSRKNNRTLLHHLTEGALCG